MKPTHPDADLLRAAVRGVGVTPDRRRKPAIAVESVGEPRALDSLAALILRRLAARERPNLTIVSDEQPSDLLPQVIEGS